ncbi:MAG: acyloxyacyl hydrolase [Allorhizobium sp.]
MKYALKFSKKMTLAVLLATSAAPLEQAFAADWSPKEVRFGVSGSIGTNGLFEKGFFPTVALYFDPLDSANAATWSQKFLRPQLHVGTMVSTAGQTSQIYAGLNWKTDLTERLFVDFGFGGTIHNGDLQWDGTDGPKLGCRVMFHEYAAAGFHINEKWDVLATVDHASHAELCSPQNSGISHAGISLAYKF